MRMIAPGSQLPLLEYFLIFFYSLYAAQIITDPDKTGKTVLSQASNQLDYPFFFFHNPPMYNKNLRIIFHITFNPLFGLPFHIMHCRLFRTETGSAMARSCHACFVEPMVKIGDEMST